MKTILFIEEKPQIREGLISLINLINGLGDFFKILTAVNVVEAIELLEKIKIEAVIADKQFTPKEVDILDQCLRLQTDVRLIVLTDEGSNISKLLETFKYAIEIKTPVDADQLLSTLCETLGIDYGGQVRGFSTASFLQMVGLESATCSLKVLANQKCGWLYCLSGNIIHASVDDLTGKEAAIILLGMENPLISIEHGRPTVERSINASLMSLLLESGRIKDESEKKTSERRRYTRFVCSSPVELIYNDWTHHCVASNLSLSGVFLLTRGPFPVGRSVCISFYSNTMGKGCEIEGTIVRRTSEGIGIVFSGLNLNQKTIVRSVVEEAVDL
jgi:hypothetical protein